MLWSEEDKVVNVLDCAEQTNATQTTDVVDMADYKRCTFIIHTGAAALNIPKVTIQAGISEGSCTTAIIFKYRTQVAAATPDSGSDVPSALTDATIAGFDLTTNVKGGVYIIEVDVREIQEAGAMTYDFDHVKMVITKGGTNAVHNYGVLAILSQPRYPQGVLKTAIG